MGYGSDLYPDLSLITIDSDLNTSYETLGKEHTDWSTTPIPIGPYYVTEETADSFLSMDIKRYFHGLYVTDSTVPEYNLPRIPVELLGINPPHIHKIQVKNEELPPGSNPQIGIHNISMKLVLLVTLKVTAILLQDQNTKIIQKELFF